MNGDKKHRGLRRYYKKLSTENFLERMTWLDFENTWLDNWKINFDNYAYGNNSFKRRKSHLDKLFRHFELFEEKVKYLKTEFQLYAIILDFDSYNDAIFLHTPNPNGTPFPIPYKDLQKDTTLKNSHLIDYLNELNGYEKLYGINQKYYGKYNEAFCLLFKKNVGVQF